MLVKTWVSGQTVVVGDEQVHIKAYGSALRFPLISPNLPDKDAKSWQKMRPSNRWAPLTKVPKYSPSWKKGRIDPSYQARLFNGLALENLKGSAPRNR